MASRDTASSQDMTSRDTAAVSSCEDDHVTMAHIRVTTEDPVHVTNTATTTTTTTPPMVTPFDGDGLSFKGKLIGSEKVSDWSETTCQRVMEELSSTSSSSSTSSMMMKMPSLSARGGGGGSSSPKERLRKQRVVVRLSTGDGLELIEEKNKQKSQQIIRGFQIRDLPFICQSKYDERIFCFVAINTFRSSIGEEEEAGTGGGGAGGVSAKTSEAYDNNNNNENNYDNNPNNQGRNDDDDVFEEAERRNDVGDRKSDSEKKQERDLILFALKMERSSSSVVRALRDLIGIIVQRRPSRRDPPQNERQNGSVDDVSNGVNNGVSDNSVSTSTVSASLLSSPATATAGTNLTLQVGEPKRPPRKTSKTNRKESSSDQKQIAIETPKEEVPVCSTSSTAAAAAAEAETISSASSAHSALSSIDESATPTTTTTPTIPDPFDKKTASKVDSNDNVFPDFQIKEELDIPPSPSLTLASTTSSSSTATSSAEASSIASSSASAKEASIAKDAPTASSTASDKEGSTTKEVSIPSSTAAVAKEASIPSSTASPAKEVIVAKKLGPPPKLRGDGSVDDDLLLYSYGIEFKAKMLGIRPVDASFGSGDKMAVSEDCLAALKANLTASKRRKQRALVDVSLNGIVIMEEKSRKLLHRHAIADVVFIALDVADARNCGYIAKGDGGGGAANFSANFVGIRALDKTAKDLFTAMQVVVGLSCEFEMQQQQQQQQQQHKLASVKQREEIVLDDDGDKPSVDNQTENDNDDAGIEADDDDEYNEEIDDILRRVTDLIQRGTNVRLALEKCDAELTRVTSITREEMTRELLQDAAELTRQGSCEEDEAEAREMIAMLEEGRSLLSSSGIESDEGVGEEEEEAEEERKVLEISAGSSSLQGEDKSRRKISVEGEGEVEVKDNGDLGEEEDDKEEKTSAAASVVVAEEGEKEVQKSKLEDSRVLNLTETEMEGENEADC